MIRTLLAAAVVLTACSNAPEQAEDAQATTSLDSYSAQLHDADRALASLETLSSDEFEGRRTGTAGNEMARDWITAQLTSLGVAPFYDSGYEAPFATGRFNEPNREVRGINLIARIEGTSGNTAPVIAMTAHYDHLGMHEGKIYNGADDNASGVAALLEAVAWFQANPPQNTIVFVFFDAEEQGIAGSAYFVRAMPENLKDRLALNLNLDMVARADKGELYAVGTHHFPDLIPLVDGVAASSPIELKRGHDSPEWGEQDWSMMSDHAPFLRAGFPVLYLGVEDHEDYHRPTDTFDRISPDVFARCVDTVMMVAEAADEWVTAQKIK